MQLQGSPWFHLFLADFSLDLFLVLLLLVLVFLFVRVRSFWFWSPFRLGSLWFLFGSPWVSFRVFLFRFFLLFCGGFLFGSPWVLVWVPFGFLFCLWLCVLSPVFGFCFVLGFFLAPFLGSSCFFLARCFCCWFHAKSFIKSCLECYTTPDFRVNCDAI